MQRHLIPPHIEPQGAGGVSYGEGMEDVQAEEDKHSSSRRQKLLTGALVAGSCKEAWGSLISTIPNKTIEK